MPRFAGLRSANGGSGAQKPMDMWRDGDGTLTLGPWNGSINTDLLWSLPLAGPCSPEKRFTTLMATGQTMTSATCSFGKETMAPACHMRAGIADPST